MLFEILKKKSDFNILTAHPLRSQAEGSKGPLHRAVPALLEPVWQELAVKVQVSLGCTVAHYVFICHQHESGSGWEGAAAHKCTDSDAVI